jgi:hypothetical protein
VLYLLSGGALAAEYPDPSDVNVGKPADISQEQFERVRRLCIKTISSGSYYEREVCERYEFVAIRKLRGDKNEKR